jgi:hypothetical protein
MADEAELAAKYDEANEAYHDKPSDKAREKRDAAAKELVEARQAGRTKRENEALALSDGDGVARPMPVEGGSEVSS